MLTIFRRHMAACKFKGRKNRNCQCPIWAAGMLHGRKIKKSLDLRSWEAAQKLVRDWEANPEGGRITVKEAGEKFLADKSTVSDGMMRKLTLVIRELTDQFGAVAVRSVKVDDIRELKRGWTFAPITMQKRIEMIRHFFRFCEESEWISRNPAKPVKVGPVHFPPTLPFTQEEMDKILWATEIIREKHPQMKLCIEKRLKALILVMRYSGIRISDAVTLTRDRIKGKKLFLYQTKTKQPVWVPVPDNVIDALREIDDGSSYYFGQASES